MCTGCWGSSHSVAWSSGTGEKAELQGPDTAASGLWPCPEGWQCPPPAPGTSNPRALPWAGVNLCRPPALHTKASPEVWRRPPSAGGVGEIEEGKALETKVGDQGVARKVPLPCPVRPSPLDKAALGLQLLTPLCRERGGQAQARDRAKDIRGVRSMLQRKERHGPARRRAHGFSFHSHPALGIHVCS